MGVGGPFGQRPRAVPLDQHVQHLLRLRDGRMVNGLRGHRLVHSLVNALLITEATGKSRALHKVVLRRLGKRVVGGEVLSRAVLRHLMATAHSKHMILGQINNLGKDVRSTPMHWKYKQKELDCAVKTLSWRPPFVRCSKLGVADPMIGLLGNSRQVEDQVGLGRIPSFWWTINSKYNAAYDVHRFNSSDAAAAAVGSLLESGKQARFDFVRDNPDLVTTLLALRTELQMRVVMPAIVPHDERTPFMAMCRFEVGDGGNPHYHGFAIGSGNPRLQRVRADVEVQEDRPGRFAGDEAADSLSEGDDGSAADASTAGSDVSDGGVAAVSGGTGQSEPPVPDAQAARANCVRLGDRRRKRRVLEPGTRTAPRLPDTLHPRNANVQHRSDMERKFWDYFRDLVCELNPIFDSGGALRATFLEDAQKPVDGLMAAGEARCPERARLRELLDEVFAPLKGEFGHATLDLQPLRRYVAALVQTSARHTMHGQNDPKGPCQSGTWCWHDMRECVWHIAGML